MQYTDASLIAATLKRDLTDSEHVTLSVLIPAVERMIDNYTHTTFKQVDAENRYYDGEGHSLDIDPCTNIEELANVDAYTGADYYLYNQSGITEVITEPVNENVKTELRLRNGEFPCGENNIRVKAQFSRYDDGIPEDITGAATAIVIDCLRSYQMGTGNVKSESLEGHSVTYNDLSSLEKTAMANPAVCSVLDYYKELLV